MTKKYCFHTPNFPQTGYIAVTFVKTPEDNHFLFPMTKVFSDNKTLYHEAIKLKKELQAKKKAEIYTILSIKIKFHKTYPLRKEHWTYVSDDDRYNSYTRGKTYLKMLNDVHQFYQIVVLPYNYNVKKKKWDFTNWIPILITANNDYIDGLMMDSDQSVDESADSMGMYTIDSVRGLDINSGKIVTPQKSATQTESNC